MTHNFSPYGHSFLNDCKHHLLDRLHIILHTTSSGFCVKFFLANRRHHNFILGVTMEPTGQFGYIQRN